MSAAHLVLGASGGIGGAVVEALRARGDSVIGTGRTRAGPDLWLDYADPDSIAALPAALRQRLMDSRTSLAGVYVCTGVLHGPQMRPERRVEALQEQAFLEAMRINALGPLRVAAELKPLLSRRQPSRLAFISARVGSIGDNHLGGWYSYRCSKAALNMGVRSLAVELGRSHPECRVTLYHPGTCDTRLSEPFQANVTTDKLFPPERAAAQFLDVLDRRGDAPGAVFLDWAGKSIPY